MKMNINLSKEDLIFIAEQVAERLIFNQNKEYGDIYFAMQLTGLSKASIYSKVCNRTIPFSKNGKLWFSKKDLEKWMMSNRFDCDDDITKYLK